MLTPNRSYKSANKTPMKKLQLTRYTYTYATVKLDQFLLIFKWISVLNNKVNSKKMAAYEGLWTTCPYTDSTCWQQKSTHQQANSANGEIPDPGSQLTNLCRQVNSLAHYVHFNSCYTQQVNIGIINKMLLLNRQPVTFIYCLVLWTLTWNVNKSVIRDQGKEEREGEVGKKVGRRAP